MAEEKVVGQEGAKPDERAGCDAAPLQEKAAALGAPEPPLANGQERGEEGVAENKDLEEAGKTEKAAPAEEAKEAPEEKDDPGTLKALLEEESKKAQEYYHRLLRLQADFENFKRRTRQEMENFYKYSSEQIIRALLPVLDNFERALAVESGSLESYKSGMEMIYRQFVDVLAAEGLTPIEAAGAPFDPARHEAVLQEETAEHPDNTVIEELRRGYCLKDKVIRPAMVKVARTPQDKSS